MFRTTLLTLLLLAALASAYYYFVYRPAHTHPVEAAYVLPPSVEVVDTPAEVRIVVGFIKSGDRVDITKRTHNWAQIRTAGNLKGWVESSNLVDSQTYEGGQKLLRDMLNIPVQAVGHTGGVVNLRLEPSRDAAQLAQLPQDLPVQIFGRRVVDRPAPPDQPPDAKVRDAWYLIRTNGRAGWVLGHFISLNIPEKISNYAQGTNLVAWVVLRTVDDGGQKVPEYIAADRMGTLEADFSHIRILTWWSKRREYVTAYAESGLSGYFPIRVAQVNGVHTFRLRLMDDQGQKFQKVYGLFDTKTRALGTVPGWESDAMPTSPEPHHHPRTGQRKG
ncbi:MAG: SH3 domain-containing protein [Terriglobia bacterium]